jgi:hypothetical protein
MNHTVLTVFQDGIVKWVCPDCGLCRHYEVSTGKWYRINPGWENINHSGGTKNDMYSLNVDEGEPIPA